MDEPTRSVFAAFAVVYTLLFAVYELMVLRVNRHLPSNDAVSLMPLRQWNRLMSEDRRLFPKSPLRGIAFGVLLVVLSLAVLLVALRVWLYLRP